MRTKLFTLCALVLSGAPLTAQTPATPLVVTLSERLRLASLLPVRTAELRDAGVSDTTVRRILDLFRVHQVDPVQVDQIFVTERDAAREHGPTDNFGAFVQRQLASGKRGRALSDAIQAEHRAHGHKHKKEKVRELETRNKDGKLRHQNLPDQGRSDPARRPN